MTLLVGIRCDGGVVIAADSAATFGSLGDQTVVQPTGRKIEVIDGRLLLATSGAVGLGQRFVGELAEAASARGQRLRGSADKVMVEISGLFRKHILAEFEAARAAVPVLGNNVAGSSAIAMSMVAMVVGTEPVLISFDQQGAPELTSEQLPFVCLGSGQRLADPFVAFLKSVFWDQGQYPSLADGIMAATWTVDQCIQIAPGGLGEPVRVFTLSRPTVGGQFEARELDQTELAETFQAIADARLALRNFRVVDASVPLPPPPSVD